MKKLKCLLCVLIMLFLVGKFDVKASANSMWYEYKTSSPKYEKLDKKPDVVGFITREHEEQADKLEIRAYYQKTTPGNNNEYSLKYVYINSLIDYSVTNVENEGATAKMKVTFYKGDNRNKTEVTIDIKSSIEINSTKEIKKKVTDGTSSSTVKFILDISDKENIKIKKIPEDNSYTYKIGTNSGETQITNEYQTIKKGSYNIFASIGGNSVASTNKESSEEQIRINDLDLVQKGQENMTIRYHLYLPDNYDDFENDELIVTIKGIKKTISDWEKDTFGNYNFEKESFGYEIKVRTSENEKSVEVSVPKFNKTVVATNKLYTSKDYSKPKEEKPSMTDLSGYGNPDDLMQILDPRYKDSVAGIILDYAGVIAAVLLYVAILTLGINIILNRTKGEERAANMNGIMYICIGIILLSSIILIYNFLADIIGEPEIYVDETVSVEVESDE